MVVHYVCSPVPLIAHIFICESSGNVALFILFILLCNPAWLDFSCKCLCLISFTGHDKNATICGRITNGFYFSHPNSRS